MIISEGQLFVFILVLARISGVFTMAPVFSTRSFPGIAKTAFAIWISFVLWFVIPVNPNLIPKTLADFFVCMLAEVATGFLIGFVCNIIFIGVQAAGEIIDIQMGLSVAQAFDPVFGSSVSIVGRLFFYATLTTFFAINGHHLLLSVLHQSFSLLPLGTIPNLTSPKLVVQLMELGKTFWTIAIQLAGPILLIIFLSDFAFGIVSRVAPQVNVFSLGFQVKPMLGLIGILFCLPILVAHISSLLELMGEEMLKLMVALR